MSISAEILDQYIVHTSKKGNYIVFTLIFKAIKLSEISKFNAELEKTDILSEIIKKDRNAIDKNKREKMLDPRYALDYKSVDVNDSVNESHSDGDIDIEFQEMRLESANKIDDVLHTFCSENGTKRLNDNNDKLAAIAVTKNILMKKNLDSNDDDSNDSDYDPIFGWLKFLLHFFEYLCVCVCTCDVLDDVNVF